VTRDAAAALLRRHVVDDEQVAARLGATPRSSTPYTSRASVCEPAVQSGALDFFEVVQAATARVEWF
jgi:hypothetical protein